MESAREVAESVALKDDMLVYRACSKAYAEALGINSPDELIGLTDFELFERDIAREQLTLDRRVISSSQASISALQLPYGNRQAILVRVPLVASNLRVRGIDMRLMVCPGNNGGDTPYPLYDYRALVSEGLQGSLIIGDNAVLFANGNAAVTLGYENAESLMRLGRVDTLLGRRERQRVAQVAVHANRTGGRLVLTAHARGGRQVRLLARATRVTWSAREATLLSFIDVVLPADTMVANSPARLLRRVRANEIRLSHFAHAGADFFWELDSSFAFTFLSRETDEILGLPRQQLLGRAHAELRAHPSSLDPDSHWEMHIKMLHAHQPFRDFEFRWLVGVEEKVIRYSGLPVFDARQRFAGYRGTGCDVTAMVHQAELAAYHASHDALTGLFNRRFFEELVREALESSNVRRQRHVLCYMDLDKFKHVNDTGGHPAGDELLRQLGQLLDERVRASDVLARIGGDEFGVLLRDCNMAEGLRFANQIRHDVETFEFLWHEHRFCVGISIGLVAVDDAWENAGALFKAADSACYIAKNEGRNRVVVHREPEDSSATQHRRALTQWVKEIQSALDQDRIQLACQKLEAMRADVATNAQDSAPDHPDIPAGTDTPWYEMLLRLQLESGEWITPTSFMSTAERYGLAVLLDERAVDLALSWLLDRRDIHGESVLCSINLSGATIADDGFAARLSSRIATSGIAPRQLCFELGETATLANLSNVSTFMHRLASIGCRFCIDGFGSGLSSFSYLRRLPVDFIKIDGPLMQSALDDSTQYALVKAISDIGRSMGKRIVAANVDSDALLETVRELDIDFAQGYHLAKPQLVAL